MDVVERDRLKALALKVLKLSLEERHRQREVADEMIVLVRDAVIGDDWDLLRLRHIKPSPRSTMRWHH